MERMLNYQMHCERLILNDLGDNNPNLSSWHVPVCIVMILRQPRGTFHLLLGSVSMIGIDRLAV